MAYLNEFPHVEANKLNLDWLLEQYSTFDKRLQELHDHFDEAVAQMEESFDQAVNQFEQTLQEYETQINSDFLSFKHDINEEVSTISNAIEQVNENIDTYLDENLPTLIEENVQLKQEIINIAKVNVSSESVTTGSTSDPTNFGLYSATFTVNANLNDVKIIDIMDNDSTIGHVKTNRKYVLTDAQTNLGITYPYYIISYLTSSTCEITIFGEASHSYQVQYIVLPS